jgi:hypothetical protein
MDFHQIAALLAAILGVVSVVPYIRDMLRGTTRPNMVTWGLWVLVQGIFVAAQWSAGASLSIVLPFVGMLAVLCVVVLGLFGYGYKKYGPIDIACLVISLSAIVLWQVTGNPMVALYLAVAADLFAGIPTFVKAYRDPASETLSAYLIAFFAAIAAGLSSTLIDVTNLLWPAYILIFNGGTVILILLGRRKRHTK